MHRPDLNSAAAGSAGAPATLAIRVAGLSKTFGTGDSRTQALKGIDFSAHEGEIHLVIGQSGCGKTTLLSVIAGTLLWEEGEVDIFGTRFNGLRPGAVTAFRGRNVGFIFQQFNLIPTLNCVENVSVPLLLNGKSRAEAEKQATEWLGRVGLGDKLSKHPTQLSGGQQQRVAIARALIHEPRLLICDEPTSALDAATGRQVMELLVGVARSAGRCVVIVTHDPRIYRYADRITELEDGRVSRVLAGPELQHFLEQPHG